MDWQRGNIPYLNLPPKTEEEVDRENNKDEEVD